MFELVAAVSRRPKRLAFSVSAIAAFAAKEGRRETAAKLSRPMLEGDISAEQIARPGLSRLQDQIR